MFVNGKQIYEVDIINTVSFATIMTVKNKTLMFKIK